MKCNKCNKTIKEDTEGNKRYCQGHSIFEEGLRLAKDYSRFQEGLEVLHKTITKGRNEK